MKSTRARSTVSYFGLIILAVVLSLNLIACGEEKPAVSSPGATANNAASNPNTETDPKKLFFKAGDKFLLAKSFAFSVVYEQQDETGRHLLAKAEGLNNLKGASDAIQFTLTDTDDTYNEMKGEWIIFSAKNLRYFKPAGSTIWKTDNPTFPFVYSESITLNNSSVATDEDVNVVGRETVEGQATYHYQLKAAFEERVSYDVWVNLATGNFQKVMVTQKYEKSTDFYTYTLSKLNEPVSIKAPI